MRFQEIDVNPEFIKLVIDMLINSGYKELSDNTGGDRDFITIDTLRKEYIWCENGFGPFCSESDMMKYQFSNSKITLKKLEKKRY